MTNLPDPFLASPLRRITVMSLRFHAYLSTRNPQTIAELHVPPTSGGEALASLVWFVLFLLAPPS